MSKAVIYEGLEGECEGDEEVTDVTVFDSVAAITEIKDGAFCGCKGLTNLSFLSSRARPSRPSGTTPSRSLASSPCKGLRA
jgi:hypothetical protein